MQKYINSFTTNLNQFKLKIGREDYSYGAEMNLSPFQVPSSPPPLTGPIARRLSISTGIGGEEGLISCVLPEDLLVEILAERLQVSMIKGCGQ